MNTEAGEFALRDFFGDRGNHQGQRKDGREDHEGNREYAFAYGFLHLSGFYQTAWGNASERPRSRRIWYNDEVWFRIRGG